MLLIQNKAILDTFNIKKTNPNNDGVIYEFKNKETGKVLKVDYNKYNHGLFFNVLSSVFFPNSVLILTEYLSDQYSGFTASKIRKHFNYKGLKISESYSGYFVYEPKPNIYFGESFYTLKDSIQNGQFPRRYVDALINQVLPLLKNEKNSFNTFFDLFQPDYSLKGKFTVSGKVISNLPMSVFSSSSQVEFDFDLTLLHGKIAVGGSGIEILDSSFIQNYEQIQRSLGLGRYVSQPPTDKLTTGDPLPYNEEVLDFKNWFYNRSDMVRA